MKKPKTFEYNLKLEWIMASLQGKRLELHDHDNDITLVLHPTQGGVFMTHEEYHEMRRSLRMEGMVGAAFNTERFVEDLMTPINKHDLKSELLKLTDIELEQLLLWRAKQFKEAKPIINNKS